MIWSEEKIIAAIINIEGIKNAMQNGEIARNEDDMKGKKPKLMFSERTADELLEAVKTIQTLRMESERYRNALSKIVSLNMPIPAEVFEIANGVLEEWIVK